jgi:hypothetical protein
VSTSVLHRHKSCDSGHLSHITNQISSWPQYTLDQSYQINLNEIGGEEFSALVSGFLNNLIFDEENEGPGLRNNITLVNAYTGEGGRGQRCEFWRKMGALVLE